ncbi:MAG: uracil-DNA glycosylase [Mariprofundaceae bacterium]
MLDERGAYYLRMMGVETPTPDVHNPFIKTAAMNERDTCSVANLSTLQGESATCRRCKRSESRHHVVFGKGSSQADILFVGGILEAEEDLAGEVFIARTGALFDQLLLALELERSDVYITTLLKCGSAVDHQEPSHDDVDLCQHWLQAQVRAISPRVICLLGRIAAQYVLASHAPLGALRHRWHEYENIQTLVTYHPLELLRTPARKEEVWTDLCKLKSYMLTL